MVEEEITTNQPEKQDLEKGPGISISDNMIILLLILFALMIGAWWFVNLFMGRWI